MEKEKTLGEITVEIEELLRHFKKQGGDKLIDKIVGRGWVILFEQKEK